MQTNTVAEKLADWVYHFSSDDLTSAVANEAMRCLIDVIGVSIAGANHSTTNIAERMGSHMYANGNSTLTGRNIACAAPAAAFFNGVAAHVLDFDDVSYEGMVHASAVVWPAVLAAGEEANVSGEDVFIAFIAAVEAEYALGRAMTHDLFWRGWWTTGLLGSIGAAMGAAKVLQLDQQEIKEAINIAASQATGPYVVVGSPLKSYACGRAAEAGLQAAMAAKYGLFGPKESFEHESGFIAMFGQNQSALDELDKLGTRFVLETSRITFKRFPVCAAGQSPLEAFQRIKRKTGLEADDISRVKCEVTSDVAHYMAIDRATNETEAQFCLPFCLACVMCYGDLKPSHLTMQIIHDPSVVEAMKKVDIEYSVELDQLCKSIKTHQNSARITVTTCVGETSTDFIAAPTGIPSNPMSDDDIENKYIACASEAIGEQESLALLSQIKSIRTLASIRTLLR